MGTKITALGAIPEVANVDVLPIVDLTDTTTKKATITQIEARFTADGFLSALDNISLLTNDSGFITVSDFSNDGENAGVNRDLGNLDAFALSFITSGVGRINIEAGGNVGIGTSTPSEVLEVVGNAKINGTFKTQSASAIPVNLYKEGVGNNMIQLSMQNDAAAEYQYAQIGGKIIDDTAGSEDGSFLVQLSNNGTLDSFGEHQFLVNGLTRFPQSINGGIFRESNSGGFRWSLNLRNSANAIEPYAALATEVIDNTNGSEDGVLKFYARSNGVNFNSSNHQAILTGTGLGIGTSTPTESLDVVGNVFVTGTQKIKTDYLSSNLSLENTSGSSTYEIGVGVAGVSVETLYFNNRLGNRTFGINLDGRFDIIEKVNLEDNIELKWGNNVSYGAFFDASYEQTMTFNNSGGRNISFDNKAAAGNPNYTFNWSGAIKGNFGIGTATPTETLEVAGKVLITQTDGLQLNQLNGRITIGNTISSTTHFLLRGTRPTLIDLGDATTSRFKIDDKGGTTIDHNGTGHAFRVDNSITNSVLHIRGDQARVGINTGTAPTKALQVGGGIEMGSSTELCKLTNITAAQASAITPSNGDFVYVSTTDGTFTSVGFWGYEAGSWVKL